MILVQYEWTELVYEGKIAEGYFKQTGGEINYHGLTTNVPSIPGVHAGHHTEHT